jgi:hypothetical protein
VLGLVDQHRRPLFWSRTGAGTVPQQRGHGRARNDGSNGPGSEAAVLDADLPWSGTVAVADGQVTAMAGTVGTSGAFQQVSPAGGPGPALLIEAASQSTPDCLYVLDYEDSSATPPISIIAYANSNNPAGCAGTSVSLPTSEPLTSAGSGAARRNRFIDLRHGLVYGVVTVSRQSRADVQGGPRGCRYWDGERA